MVACGSGSQLVLHVVAIATPKEEEDPKRKSTSTKEGGGGRRQRASVHFLFDTKCHTPRPRRPRTWDGGDTTCGQLSPREKSPPLWTTSHTVLELFKDPMLNILNISCSSLLSGLNLAAMGFSVWKVHCIVWSLFCSWSWRVMPPTCLISYFINVTQKMNLQRPFSSVCHQITVILY